MDCTNRKVEYHEDIFSPKGSFDLKRYVTRETLENLYSSAIKGNQNILVRGNSGTGKTWLTNKVLLDNEVGNATINCAEVARMGSFEKYFEQSCQIVATKQTDSLSAKVKAFFAEGKGHTKKDYIIHTNFFVEYLKKVPGNNKKFIVLENFEHLLVSPQLIKELACLIPMLDDCNYERYKTRFIIISTTTSTVSFFKDLPNHDTIDNRIYELCEVKGLTYPECTQLILKGFKTIEFEISAYESGPLAEQIYNLTDGIPQRVLELCECIYQVHSINKTNKLNLSFISRAQTLWATTSLSKNYSLLIKYFSENSKNKKDLNIILYTIANMGKHTFDSLKVQAKISEFFPKAIIGKTKVKHYLEKVSDTTSNNNILVQNDTSFSIRDIKYILCLRALLFKKDDMVEMYDISDYPDDVIAK